MLLSRCVRVSNRILNADNDDEYTINRSITILIPGLVSICVFMPRPVNFLVI